MTAMGTTKIGYSAKFYLFGVFRGRRFAERNGFSAFRAINHEIPLSRLDKAGHSAIPEHAICTPIARHALGSQSRGNVPANSGPSLRALFGHCAEYDSHDGKSYSGNQHPPNGTVEAPLPFLEGAKFPCSPSSFHA